MILKADMVGETPYKKFMFDTDFDELAARREKARAAAAAKADREDAAETEPEPEPEAPTFSEEDLARSRAEGVTEGRRLGIEEAASTVEKQIADTLNTIVQQAQTLFETQAQANQDVTHHAVAVAATLVRKLFPALNQETALDQVRSMLEAALSQVSGESEIVVRVPADMAEDLHGRIEAVSDLSGFRGNIKVLGDPGLAVGDCRLEWSSGGVKRSARDLARQLDEIVARNLESATPLRSASGPDAADPTDDAVPAVETDEARPEDGADKGNVAGAQPAGVEEAATIETAPAIAPETDLIQETGMIPELTAEDIAAGPAPVPSDDLVADATPEEAGGDSAGDAEHAAPEPARYGGADLELEDDLKD